MNAAHYAPEPIICAMKYNYVSCCVLVQVFITAAASAPTDVPSSPLQSVLALGAGAASVPAAEADPLPEGWRRPKCSAERCPRFGAGCVTKPSDLIPEHRSCTLQAEGSCSQNAQDPGWMPGCAERMALMDFIAGKVAAVSSAEQV